MMPPERIRFQIDGHYTAEGHRRMADLLIAHGQDVDRLRRGVAKNDATHPSSHDLAGIVEQRVEHRHHKQRE